MVMLLFGWTVPPPFLSETAHVAQGAGGALRGEPNLRLNDVRLSRRIFKELSRCTGLDWAMRQC